MHNQYLPLEQSVREVEKGGQGQTRRKAISPFDIAGKRGPTALYAQLSGQLVSDALAAYTHSSFGPISGLKPASAGIAI